MKKSYLILLAAIFLVLPLCVQAETMRGIFGVPSVGKVDPKTYLSRLRKAGINAVFVPADRKTVKWFSDHGFNVYLTINVFGGKKAWEMFPDARPVKADGTLLGTDPEYRGHGGVCPSHEGWRKERLALIEKTVREFSEYGLAGIWLDYIRYPGLWETKVPAIPDTCYNSKCLEKFQTDLDFKIPLGFSLPGDIDVNDAQAAAEWIRENRSYDWMIWKKEQIRSFVADVRKIIDRIPREKRPLLGLFLVPWTKGERDNAVSYGLAQDAFQLSGLADVISPMVYHNMIGRTENWVGYMTRYYKETAHSRVWPIVQANDVNKGSFGKVLKFAGQGGADGILVYAFDGMGRDMWKTFDAFQAPVNMIRNPEFLVPPGEDMPSGWHTGKSGKPRKLSRNVNKSIFTLKSSDKFDQRQKKPIAGPPFDFLGIFAGNDRSGIWSSSLPAGDSGGEYLFTGLLYRDTWANGIFSIISLWGEEFYVNNHWFSETFQPVRLFVRYPRRPRDKALRFINHNAGRSFWLAKPHLTRYHPFYWEDAFYEEGRGQMASKDPPSFYMDFFPIGVYGADISNLKQVKALSLNTVVIGGRGESLKKMVLRSHDLGLKVMLSVPRDPDGLLPYLEEISGYVHPDETAFYVNDEPGLRSFPVNRANDINRLIKSRFPGSPTAMAVVRPQVSRDYLEASDFFMMDQYPVPFMPMTWLSDSMDRAARDTGRNRLVSVIQAFGSEKRKIAGWPRMPTWQEMDSLSFLSIVHGSRAIFFYTFSKIGRTDEGLSRLTRVVERLNRIYPWLLVDNIVPLPKIDMVSTYQVDPAGRPAIHACVKKKGDQLLLIAVNTIGTYVEGVIRFGELKVKGFNMREIRDAEEIFSETSYPVIDGGVRVKFQPYETKAFLSAP